MEEYRLKSVKRNEVEEKYTWDLKDLCESPEAFDTGLKEVEADIHEFSKKYKGKLNDVDVITEMISEYEKLQEKFIRVYGYANMNISVERGNPAFQEI